MNVRRLLILLTLPLFSSGCAVIDFFKGEDVKPVTVQTKAVERERLSLEEPAPLKGREIKWMVITPDNVDAVFKTFKEGNTDLVLFALTDNGYEQLSLSMAEIRNYIAAQRAVILKYKQYYEPEMKK